MNTQISILYVGNKLSKHGYTPTSIETIGEWLKGHFFIKQVSDYKIPAIRLLHMLYSAFTFRGNLVMVDTYSSLLFYYAFLVAVVCKLRGLPYIAVIRGGEFPDRIKRSPRKVKFLLNNAGKVVAPSDYIRAKIKKEWNGKVMVIPNAIDIQKYPFLQREKISPHLLWVRSFHSVYNPTLALDVLRLLKEHYPNASICMIGPDKDGSLELFKEYAGKLSLNDSVIITGMISKAEWHEKSKEYDIFINTTNADNTPVSVMEAMALGMPVVTTNVGGIPYLFEDKKEGLMVPPKNAEAIVVQVLKLLKDPSYTSQISRSAREKACQWDWMIVKEKWIKMVIEVANDIQ